jgi:hypothetical protein
MSEQPRIWRSAQTGRYHRQPNAGVYEAQLVTPSDISDIEAVTILDEVLGLARPQYTLRGLCRVIRMDALTARIDVATKLAGREKVPPLVEAELSAQDYTPVEFELWKNVVHVALSDEAMKKAAHDILGLHVSDASRDLSRMENKQISEELATATEDSGADWATTTNNPFDDIIPNITTIEGNGYPVDWIAAPPLVWGDFFSNPFVKGSLQGVQLPAGKTFQVPGLPGVKGISDSQLTSTSAYIGSSQAPAIVLGEGPTEAARYRDEKAGYDAYIIRQWLQPKLVVGDAVRELTGVHS